jgi:hypothetical protein
MRATLFLVSFLLAFGLFLWVTFSGALIVFSALFWLVLVFISVGYQDTMLLFLLGAREIRSGDEKIFFEAASQEAYKLAVPRPRLFFYNGSLDRVFVFQSYRSVSIVVNKSFLGNATPLELQGICFELLLQVKKGMAPKRTKIMFLLGTGSWLLHSLLGLLTALLPLRDVREGVNWFLNFLIFPVLEFLYRLALGESYFRRLEGYLDEFPREKELLAHLGLKLRKPYSYYSLPSRKLLELQASGKSRHYQSIIALEFLPHEWDYLFRGGELNRAV